MSHFPLGRGGSGGGGGGGGGVNLPVAVKELFFGDGSETRETMMQYVSSTPAVTSVYVPGDDRVHVKCSRRARRTTAALVKWFCHLHALGYAFDGAFNEDSFGVDQLGHLRGSTSQLSLVREISATVNGVSSNMLVVAGIIENHIHSPLQIPEDVSHLLDLLKQYNISLSPLVQSHASLDEEDVGSALFTRMHKRFKVLEKVVPTAHGNLLQALQQIPNTSGWLGSAMHNTHLHSVLRYTKWKRGLARTLNNVIVTFLMTKVQYGDDAVGLLTCRRNGQAHMEADYSVDVIGYIEAALFGAAEGLRTYHQLAYNTAVAAAQQQLQVPYVMPLATLLLKPIPTAVASVIGQALEQFLSGTQLSLDAAKVGAAAAANYLVMQPNVFNRRAHCSLTQNAVAAAGVAAQAVQGQVAQPLPPLEMFNADDINHIYHIVSPRLLVGFQSAMFAAGECFRLGEDTSMPELT